MNPYLLATGCALAVISGITWALHGWLWALVLIAVVLGLVLLFLALLGSLLFLAPPEWWMRPWR